MDVPQVFSALGGRPESLRRALPALVGRLENPPPAEAALEKKRRSFDFDRAYISYALRGLGAADLAPFSERLLSLASRAGENWTAGLIAILPKLDHDPVPILEEALKSDRTDIRRSAAQTACRSKPDVQLAIKPSLLRAWRKKSSDDRRAIARALIRMGEQEALEASELSERDQRRFFYERGKKLEPGFDPKFCAS